MHHDGVRIAMWSGPRNISTALLRSWGNRADTVVVDEPLYAHYLANTDVDHPGRDEVLAAHDSDWRRVVAELTGPLAQGVTISYQKHMAHHLLPSIGRDWLSLLSHAFLIRDPREMVPSLAKVMPSPTVTDTGLPKQVELYRFVSAQGVSAPVVDARDVLLQPEATLRSLCEQLGVPFDPSMLSWPPGPRDTDGAWARWWYDAVIASTGFAPYRHEAAPAAPELSDLIDECLSYYEDLHQVRITA